MTRSMFSIGCMAYFTLAIAANSGCVRSPGMALLTFEFHSNGQIVHKFQKSIIDNSSLSQRWDLLKGAELPNMIVTPGRSGGALLSGDFEVRMVHGNTVISTAQVRDVALVPTSETSTTWTVRHAEVLRIKQLAGVKD